MTELWVRARSLRFRTSFFAWINWYDKITLIKLMKGDRNEGIYT